MREFKNSNFFHNSHGLVAVLGPALTVWVTAVEALISGFREIRIIMAARVVTTSKVVRGVNNSSSLVIRATQNS